MILIVDDNSSLNKTIKRYFDSLNIPCVLAFSVKEAWELILAMPFRLVLTDIGMPDEDGFILIDRLLQHAPVSSTPVIAMSGSWSSKQLLLAENLGVKLCLCKPFPMNQLRDSVLANMADIDPQKP